MRGVSTSSTSSSTLISTPSSVHCRSSGTAAASARSRSRSRGGSYGRRGSNCSAAARRLGALLLRLGSRARRDRPLPAASAERTELNRARPPRRGSGAAAPPSRACAPLACGGRGSRRDRCSCRARPLRRRAPAVVQLRQPVHFTSGWRHGPWRASCDARRPHRRAGGRVAASPVGDVYANREYGMRTFVFCGLLLDVGMGAGAPGTAAPGSLPAAARAPARSARVLAGHRRRRRRRRRRPKVAAQPLIPWREW